MRQIWTIINEYGRLISDYCTACKECRVGIIGAIKYIMDYQHITNALEAVFDDTAEIRQASTTQLGCKAYGIGNMSAKGRRLSSTPNGRDRARY